MSRSLISRSDERARAILEPLLALGLFPRSMPNVWTDGERIEIDLIVGHITDPQWRALQSWFLRAEYVFGYADDEPAAVLLDRSHASVVPWEVGRALQDGADAIAILLDRWRIPFHDEREMPF